MDAAVGCPYEQATALLIDVEKLDTYILNLKPDDVGKDALCYTCHKCPDMCTSSQSYMKSALGLFVRPPRPVVSRRQISFVCVI